ncbi:MAG: response regulator transcription factor [Acidobacteriia bacterium]|nr:response regulator transcription factor [Terriglobia bacterium]
MAAPIIIYSKHPLALQVIAQALASDEALCAEAVALGTLEKPCLDCPGQVLVLDSCSQQQWLEIALEWQQGGGHVIVLVAHNSSHRIEQVRSLYLGVRGIVSLSPGLDAELPKAVRAVLEGGLWVNREILDEYVRRTNSSVQRMADVKLRFTNREEQVAHFIVRGYSNKQIASALQISERTVKYHVSHILQKSCAATRKELLQSIDLLDFSAPIAGYKAPAAFQPNGSAGFPGIIPATSMREARS